MAKKEKRIMRQLIGKRGINDVAGVQALVKELTAGLIQSWIHSPLKFSASLSFDVLNQKLSKPEHFPIKISCEFGLVFKRENVIRC